MKFKGDLLITDPCYIKGTRLPMLERDTIYGDWSCMVYEGDLESNSKPKEWDKFYFDFYYRYNSSGMSEDEKRELRKEFDEFKEKWKGNIIGEFCADSGRVGVFDYGTLEEESKKWVAEHNWCATVIRDFDGDVSIKVVDGAVHVIGKGSRDFFSVQCGF